MRPSSSCQVSLQFVCVAALSWYVALADDAPTNKRSTATFAGTKAGQVRHDNGLKMKFVWCPPGTFTMADSIYNPKKINEPIKLAPVIVTLSKGYWIGQFEVTRSEWKQVMKTRPWHHFAIDDARLPADYITWNDAMDFCRKLTQQERHAGRLPEAWEYALPTEAQWERACRAGTQTRFSFGDDESKLGEYAWYYENSSRARLQLLHPVGQKKANPWGIYDMYGNVLEWCRDLYAEKPPGGRDPEVKPQSPADSHRVIRGGFAISSAPQCESGYRQMASPGYRDGNFGGRGGGNVGFRVALVPSGQ